MKTWKKIEDTRKRTNEIVSLKNRNEERLRMVSQTNLKSYFYCVERERNVGEVGDGALPI